MPVPPPPTDVAFVEAASAFRRFFSELRESFLEREALFAQLELGLLCKEHCLIIGPPGTAKSAVASAVLGRIVDHHSNRPSLFAKQLAENTVQTDLIGPVDFKVLTETGRTEHLTEEGMLGAVHAFLDEVFDGRDMLLRSILNVLHERELKHGRLVTAGRFECAVMTSNRYLSEVLQRSPETLQAFADRISFICFAPRNFARKQSRAQMLWLASTAQRPDLRERLTLQQLDVLQAASAAVEVPPSVAEGLEAVADALERELMSQVARLPDYVPTKYFSQRTMVKALWALKAAVIRDRVYQHPDRSLVAEPTDLAALDSFFLLGGPRGEELELLLKGSADPRERAQLEIIRVERKAFDEVLRRILPTLQSGPEREATELRIRDEVASANSMTRTWSPAVATTLATALKDKLVPGPRHVENKAPLLKAAVDLLVGLEGAVSTGFGAKESRTQARIESFAHVLELLRRVPDLQSRVPALAARLAELCRETADVIALGAESAEFDDELQPSAIPSPAREASGELAALASLARACASSVREEQVLQEQLTHARDRVAVALGRRATRALAPTQFGGGELLGGLARDSLQLKELEAVLCRLSPSQLGLRARLLVPLGQAYALQELRSPAVASVERLLRHFQEVLEVLRREGTPHEPVVSHLHETIAARVREFASGLTQPAPLTVPQGPPLTSGEAYHTYRQHFGKAPSEGSFSAFKRLSDLMKQLAGVNLSSELRATFEAHELAWVSARLDFLKVWLAALLKVLPSPTSIRQRAEADRAFALFLTSRFPMLVTREAEFASIRSALGLVASESGTVAGHARGLEAALEKLTEEFSTFSRRLLDVRASL